jgi:hypothetical protein
MTSLNAERIMGHIFYQDSEKQRFNNKTVNEGWGGNSTGRAPIWQVQRPAFKPSTTKTEGRRRRKEREKVI